MIQYIIRSLKNPHTGGLKLYPQIAPTGTMTKQQVIDVIERTTTLTSADIKACLDALEWAIIDAMKDGKAVRLGDLGSFRPTITADGTATLEKCNASLIKRVRVRFTPSGRMSALMVKKNLKFQPFKFVVTGDGQAAQQSSVNSGV